MITNIKETAVRRAADAGTRTRYSRREDFLARWRATLCSTTERRPHAAGAQRVGLTIITASHLKLLALSGASPVYTSASG